MSREEDLVVLETKVVIVGDTGVGKTSMVNRYIRRQFMAHTKATIGAAFMKKTAIVGNWKVVLQIWDTAGQERYRSMAPMYYRGAHAAIVVFDVTDPATLDKVGSWLEELQTYANPDVVLAMAANKTDMVTKETQAQCVSGKEAQARAKQLQANLFHTSAKTGAGIDELFQFVARKLQSRESVQRKQQEKSTHADVSIDLTKGMEKHKKGCCGGGAQQNPQ